MMPGRFWSRFLTASRAAPYLKADSTMMTAKSQDIGKAAARYNYEKSATVNAVTYCIFASLGALLFGWDLGVSGGVATMEHFLKTYFTSVWEAKYGVHRFSTTSPYCQYDSQLLQLLQSILYIGAIIASLLGAYLAKHKGRKRCMVWAGLWYLLGCGLTSGAVENKPSAGLAMLMIGRFSFGMGIGFGTSAGNVYLAEMAPPKYRGTLNMVYQLCVVGTVVVGQLVNLSIEKYEKFGWRISLALAAVPAILTLAGGIFLPESPCSLVSMGRHDEGRAVLRKLRGQEDVELEMQDIRDDARRDALVRHPILEIWKPTYRPYLVISVMMAVFQQMSGINAVMFYAPQLFSSLGQSHKQALVKTVIVGAVNCGGTLFALVTVDGLGRRALLIWSGILMVITQIIVAICLAHYLKGDLKLSSSVGNGILAVICSFVATYACSWGSLAWLVPAEVSPAEIRTAGMAVSTAVNMLFHFIIGQCFLSMLCRMQYGAFLFFAGWCLISVVFTIFLLPETKGLHVEEVYELFTRHWFWKRYPPPPRPTIPVIDSASSIIELNPVP